MAKKEGRYVSMKMKDGKRWNKKSETRKFWEDIGLVLPEVIVG